MLCYLHQCSPPQKCQIGDGVLGGAFSCGVCDDDGGGGGYQSDNPDL